MSQKRKNICCMMRGYQQKPNNGGVIRNQHNDTISIFWNAKDSQISDHFGHNPLDYYEPEEED